MCIRESKEQQGYAHVIFLSFDNQSIVRTTYMRIRYTQHTVRRLLGYHIGGSATSVHLLTPMSMLSAKSTNSDRNFTL